MKSISKKLIILLFCSIVSAGIIHITSKAAEPAPTGLRQVADKTEETRLVLSWNEVADADGYVFYVSEDTVYEENDQWSIEGGNITTARFNPLKSGTTYYVKIAAYNWDAGSESFIFSDFSDVIKTDTCPSVSAMGSLTQKSASKSSVTIQWKASPGATSYNIYNYANNAYVGNSKTNSYTIKGLAPATGYAFFVRPVRNGVENSHNIRNTNIMTLPAAPNDRVYFSGGNLDKNTVSYGVQLNGNESGFEIGIYQNKKLIKVLKSSSQTVKIKRDKAYQYRARTYIIVNGNKKFSSWTSNKKFVVQKLKLKKKGKNLKASWKKVSGVTRYEISVSTNRKNWKPFKKLGKNKKSVLVTKYGKKPLKKNNGYYVRIVAYFGNQVNGTNVIAYLIPRYRY